MTMQYIVVSNVITRL